MKKEPPPNSLTKRTKAKFLFDVVLVLIFIAAPVALLNRHDLTALAQSTDGLIKITQISAFALVMALAFTWVSNKMEPKPPTSKFRLAVEILVDGLTMGLAAFGLALLLFEIDVVLSALIGVAVIIVHLLVMWLVFRENFR